MEDVPFAVIIPTYQRGDGSTPFYLKRALDSLTKQTYQNFEVFVIGDKYENDKELRGLCNSYYEDRFLEIRCLNLQYAKERDKYFDNPEVLWSYGGVNANNKGIEYALSEGFEYIIHLDHDDYFAPNHLENFNTVIKETCAFWLCSKSTYKENTVLPLLNTNEKYVPFIPEPCTLIHSSTCINYTQLNFRYRDMFEETGEISLPADAQMWQDMGEVIRRENLTSVLINDVTCFHDQEGAVRNGNI